MKDLIVRALGEDERRRFFKFTENLPDRDFWGKKGRLLRGDFERFKGFFGYIRSFEPKCFFVAEEEREFVGFAVAVYNPEWVHELKERYGCPVDERAYILGIAVIRRRIDVLKALTVNLTQYFSEKGIKSIEYPTLGNVCLTTGTDVLTPENLDELIMFREAGFKISECYYSMKLDMDTYEHSRDYSLDEGRFRLEGRTLEIFRENEVLGKITWEPVESARTSIDISVARTSRGRGFGTALLAKALRLLKNKGVNVVELGVDGNNLPALKLYRKFGFEVVATHFYIVAPCHR